MKRKKWLAALLSVVMVLTLIPITAFAVTGSGAERDPYVVTTEAELNEAINSASDGSPTYIRLGEDITLNADLTIPYDKDVVIDGDNQQYTLTATGYTIRATSTMEFRDLKVAGSNYKFLVGNTANNFDHSSPANVTFRNCVIEDAVPAETNGYRGVIYINSWSDCQPTVGIIDSSISAEGNGAYTAGIMFSGAATENGGGTLNITNTDITVSGNRSSAMIIYANGSDVNISGGTFTNTNYYGISLRSQNAQVDVSGTAINAWAGIYFDDWSSDGWPCRNNTVNLKSGTVINGSNPHASADGSNNFASVVFYGQGDTLNLDDGAVINTIGTASGDYQFAALFQNANTDNQFNVNGTLTLSGAPNGWYFGAVTGINSNLNEVIEIGDTADIDGFVLERGNGESARFYHAYTTLAGAVENAEDGDTITLYANSDEAITTDKTITVIPNEHTANISASEGYVVINNEDGTQQIVEGYPISITVNNADYGTISAPYYAETDDTVTLTATANEGYEFVEWQVVSGGVTIENNSFTMPAEAVVITAVFEPIDYTVTVSANNTEYGTVSANPNSANVGDTVTLTATANEGYEFVEWQVVSGNVTIENNSFTMPAQDVEIKAVFKAKADIGTDDGSGAGEESTPPEDETTPPADSDSTDNTTSGTVDKDDSVPQTGDSNNLALWIAVMMVASAGLVGTVLYSKKRKYSR